MFPEDLSDLSAPTPHKLANLTRRPSMARRMMLSVRIWARKRQGREE